MNAPNVRVDARNSCVILRHGLAAPSGPDVTGWPPPTFPVPGVARKGPDYSDPKSYKIWDNLHGAGVLY